MEAGARGGPFAFIVPPEQFDPHAANKLRQLLLDGAVEIQRALEPFRVADTVYPSGTDFVLMAQPFRAYAKTLLEKQTYPVQRRAANTSPERPYDVAGWTLPWQAGVKVDRIEQTFEPPPTTTRLERASIAPAQIWGDRKPGYFIIDGRGNGGSIAVNRLQAAGLSVAWTTGALEIEGFTYAPGAVIVTEPAKALAVVEGIVSTLGLRATGVRGRPPAGTTPLSRARVGLYKPWIENIDEGWTRWVLEQYEFPFESLTDRDIRSGGLRARVDVIILPDQAPDRIMNGHAAGTMPAEYTGGIGTEGASSLKQFVDAGGTLITLDSSSELAITLLNLPVRDLVRGVPPDQFSCRGRSCGSRSIPPSRWRSVCPQRPPPCSHSAAPSRSHRRPSARPPIQRSSLRARGLSRATAVRTRS